MTEHAPGIITRTDTSVAPSISLSIGSKTSKKSSRETCLGTTHSVSMSVPGPCTPNRYEPKVKILPPAAFAAASERPRDIDTVRTNFFTRAATRPRTISLLRDHCQRLNALGAMMTSALPQVYMANPRRENLRNSKLPKPSIAPRDP
jgi:hypothetical protein